jgi:DNA polymerase (family 10)
MDKAEVASVLEEIAALLELKGENPFKVRAYQNGARILLAHPEDLSTVVKENRLTDIKGIGEALAEKITILVTTGKLPYYEDLRKSLHPGLLELVRIQGLGPKKAVLLHEKLKINNLADLEKAARAGKIAKLSGFGETTQENILKGLAFQSEHAQEHLINEAEETADAVVGELKKLPEVKQIMAGGSLRRRREIVHDVDILVSCSRGTEKIMKRFIQLPGVERVLGEGETKSSVLFQNGMQVDLRVVKDAQFPYALHYFTGNKDHNIRMRQRAQQRGMKLNEYGLFKEGDKLVPCKNEEQLFAQMGLSYIPPELREDRGEFEAAEKNTLPTLLEVQDIQGVFHVHSTWSDGTVELEGMIEEAQRMGLTYVGISDHSQVAAYAGGLSIERVKEQGQVIEKLRKKFKIHIFWGSECDVLRDGRMDYPDEVLKNYDFVIASVHSFFTMPEAEMTARITRALNNKYVTILGHPTGRLLLKRKGYALNQEKILKTAADQGVAIEINALEERLELDWRDIPHAKELGCQFSINPDAHSIAHLRGYPRGVGIARKGWLTKADVINTKNLTEMKSFLRLRR